ncbi:SAM-dependent methyltransferase [Arthrobacter sp. MYb227]|uniref:class I SAM-dependent methyltransferase n=1 Tax=Arthrobacter sp. MYb227 TaxID=1848601 RepID=UPI000CFBB444|nr:class I SAM-dependent methyltransferase [Arthrobacter sp. MYb227]PQZ92332.1 SAM-dependent methyltransferase [Arthrobacter sp. MYb227]
MTNNHHQHGHHPTEHTGSHSHEHSHSPEDEARMAKMLDLDASVLADHLAEVTDWIAGNAGTPHKIADLGSGTGTGTIALARHFTAGTVYAVDSSKTMLERLHSRVVALGLNEHVVTVHADLDAQWPEIGNLDLVWAASSMHHVAKPAKTFAEVFAAMNAGGVFAVIEMDGFPRYIPEDLELGTHGLEARIRAIIDNRGWNKYPDWETDLVAAGFEVEQRIFSYDFAPEPEVVGPYAELLLGNVRTGIADQLSPEDLPIIDALLDQAHPAALVNRTDIRLRGSRTVWLARKP